MLSTQEERVATIKQSKKNNLFLIRQHNCLNQTLVFASHHLQDVLSLIQRGNVLRFQLTLRQKNSKEVM